MSELWFVSFFVFAMPFSIVVRKLVPTFRFCHGVGYFLILCVHSAVLSVTELSISLAVPPNGINKVLLPVSIITEPFVTLENTARVFFFKRPFLREKLEGHLM